MSSAVRATRVLAACLFALIVLAAVPVGAATLTLGWDANTEPDLAGYLIRYGTASGRYTNQVDAGNVTQYTLQGLADGTYYVVVEAYNTAGMASGPSNEVTAVVKTVVIGPSLSPDLDGDHKSDLVLWRGSTGTWTWLTSGSGFADGSLQTKQWGSGALGDIALSADIDGDHIGDLVVWRASTGTWYWLTSSSGYSYASAGSRQWGSGALGDVPLLADMDGDGRADLVVWRASTGTWYWLTSSSGYSYASAGSRQWGSGALGDVPSLGDFDGDGLPDLCVWRPTDGTWYWLTSSSGYSYAAAHSRQWGSSAYGDIPLPGDFDGDGLMDLAVWRASTGTWYWLTSSAGYSYAAAHSVQWGSSALGDEPFLADLDGDGKADIGVWRATDGTWYWLGSATAYAYTSASGKQFGSSAAGDSPVIK